MTRAWILNGDCRQVLAQLPADSIDSVVTDPPYELGFMGKKWDASGVAFDPETWRAVLRVLKPGAHMLAFSGTRTYHRMVCAIEDAGFEIRDQLAWMYGSGFPKSLDVSKAIDASYGVEQPINADGVIANEQWSGWGTALKPAQEPIVLARKPLARGCTVAANVLAHGTGGINVDGCRIGWDPDDLAKKQQWAERYGANDYGSGDVYGGGEGLTASGGAGQQVAPNAAGRWPANVLLDETAAAMLDAQSGTSRARKNEKSDGRTHAHNEIYGEGKGWGRHDPDNSYGDSGGASRFFFVAREDDSEWLHANLGLANTAAGPLSLQNPAVASALSAAVTRALPEGDACVVSSAPSTSATPSESRRIVESAIAAILYIERMYSLGLLPESITVSDSRASCVVETGPTGITRITIDRWRSNGSADPVTFSNTSPSSAAGVAACRFSYVAKASRAEREAGLDHLPKHTAGELTDREEGSDGLKSPRAGAGRTSSGRANNHPTVKPIALMRYLVRLVTPPGGTVLDPFAGSGTTLCAAVQEGFFGVGIEMTPEYIPIIEGRLAHFMGASHG
jgi:DNA modification methylase